MYAGAHVAPLFGAPTTRRLYELTVGAVTAMYAFAWALRPPMKLYASGDNPRPRGSSAGSHSNRFSPSRHRLKWKWQPLPVRFANGFGMNVASRPRSCARDSTM